MGKNTVFVVGAGASKEVNLPSGHELKGEISQLLDIRFDFGDRLKHGDYKIVDALKKVVQQPNEGCCNVVKIQINTEFCSHKMA